MKSFNLDVGNLPDRETVQHLESSWEEETVLFRVTKAWVAEFKIFFDDNDILHNSDCPVHHAIRELNNSLVELEKHNRACAKNFIMEYPGPTSLHHTLHFKKEDRGQTSLRLEWCKDWPLDAGVPVDSVGVFDTDEIKSEIARVVSEYLSFLESNFHEFYPKWALGTDPLFGCFQRT